MHRQSSRSATNYDALDCHVNTSDLVHEEEPHNHEPKPQRFVQPRHRHSERKDNSVSQSRRTDSSRRDQPPKRSRETSNRRSPPLMTDKRYPNAPLVASSRSQHRHYPSQRNTRGSSPSPSPPPPPLDITDLVVQSLQSRSNDPTRTLDHLRSGDMPYIVLDHCQQIPLPRYQRQRQRINRCRENQKGSLPAVTREI